MESIAVEAIKILPEELWDQIILQVESPLDLQSCLNTCKLFRKILFPRKNIFMFDAAFPLIFPSLTGSSVLKLRGVCKGWNLAVDSFLESDSSLSLGPYYDPSTNPFFPKTTAAQEKQIGLYEYGSSGWADFPHFCDRYNVSPERDLRRKNFIKEMRDHPRNPFIGRSLTVIEYYPDFDEIDKLDPPEEGYRPWHPLQEFLETFGKHIWHLTFILTQHNYELVGQNYIVRFLQEDLQKYLLNLKSLKIENPDSCGEEGNIDNEIDENEEIISNLPNLEKLEVNGSCLSDYMPQKVWVCFIQKYCAQLKSLQIMEWEPFEDMEFPNLVELDLEYVPSRYESVRIGYLETPKLERLRISLYRNSFEGEGLKTLIGELNRLSQTAPNFCSFQLKRFNGVQVSGRGANWAKNKRRLESVEFQNLKCRVAPANLKTLEIKERMGWPNYDFLQKFPFLENLKIIQENPKQIPERFEDLVEVVEINAFGHQKRLYESNVWNILPNLKNLTFRGDIYTRKGCNLFRQKRKSSQTILS